MSRPLYRESFAKKAMRDRVFSEIPDPAAKRFCVIAGHGGDVQHLIAKGVPPEQITAVDIERDRLDGLPERVTTVHASILEAQAKAQFDVVAVDLCNALSATTLALLAQSLNSAGYGRAAPAYWIATLMAGRSDLAAGTPPVSLAARRLRRGLASLGRHEDHIFHEAVAQAASGEHRLKSLLDDRSGSPLAARPLALACALLVRLFKEVRADVFFAGTYHTGKVPMYTVGLRCWDRRLSPDPAELPLQCSHYNNKTGENIVRLSCRLGAPGEVFGVSARTVAAWRAHATRGTYAKQK